MMRSLLLGALVLASDFFRARAAAPAELPNGAGSSSTVVIDDSWHLWLDQKAEWQNDKLYLPDEVDLAKLPVNAPTGGWDVLSDQAGLAVTLPGTVEEHYWGKPPLPVAGSTKPEAIVSLSSPYLGVAWWYRTFTPPALKPGEHLIFSFNGARLRAEVYVNGQLVGYNIITEIPFTADATSALKSGQPNHLAVRITSPPGTYSWGDYDLRSWGDYKMPISKGFNGIAGGVTMSVQGARRGGRSRRAEQPQSPHGEPAGRGGLNRAGLQGARGLVDFTRRPGSLERHR